MDQLEKLLYLSGIASEYLDYSGNRQIIPQETRLEALRRMGHDPDNAAAVEEAVWELDSKHWSRLCQSFNVVQQNDQKLIVYCSQERLGKPLSWSISRENSNATEKESWSVAAEGSAVPNSLKEVGDYDLSGQHYSARELPLGGLPPGYYTVVLKQSNQSVEVSVAVCPSSSYKLPAREKFWGYSCQLYTLRSKRNWGIGDFSDLQELLKLAAQQGADFIGLNPLHAPISENAETPSPYSPSDRRRLNPLYIAIDEMAEVEVSNSLQSKFNERGFAARLSRLREQEQIDYHQVAVVKYAALEDVFESFQARLQDEADAQTKEFRCFVERAGDSLLDFCEYEIAHNRYTSRFQENIEFYQYLQWVSELQLRQCQVFAKDLGMHIGLLGDLAVGAVPEGSEVQSSNGLYLMNVAIGAPPDPFSETGQNWGVPAPSPVAFRGQRFAHFIDLLRSNMQHVGGLRIDHSMSMMRLWWCLSGSSSDARDGVYVYYPMAELMALLRLESQLNNCLIIAEDLGVVPAEFRAEMAASGLFSNKIFYFEQGYDGAFNQPGEQATDALLMITNHDVPTLWDWWSGTDLQRRMDLGLISSELFSQETEKRQRDRFALLRWLRENRALPEEWSNGDCQKPFDFSLCQAIHSTCARSNAQLLSMQLEDLQVAIAPINIPGTNTEYSNWRRKQLATTDEILGTEIAKNITQAINQQRKI